MQFALLLELHGPRVFSLAAHKHSHLFLSLVVFVSHFSLSLSLPGVLHFQYLIGLGLGNAYWPLSLLCVSECECGVSSEWVSAWLRLINIFDGLCVSVCVLHNWICFSFISQFLFCIFIHVLIVFVLSELGLFWVCLCVCVCISFIIVCLLATYKLYARVYGYFRRSSTSLIIFNIFSNVVWNSAHFWWWCPSQNSISIVSLNNK